MGLANDRVDLLEHGEIGEEASPDESTFWDEMVEHIEQRRAATVDPEEASFFNRPLSEHELVEWLSFQAYYELRACQFIGGWLATTPETDAMVLLAQQVEDEGNHYEYCMRALARRGVTSLDNWTPEPEWEEWIDGWYPSGADTIERVAAHNLTGELGACQAFLQISPRLPDDVRKAFDRIIPDEQFHMKLDQAAPIATPAELADYDAIIFGAPTYMGSVLWQFKKFADASSKPWYTQAWMNKLAAGFTNSASMNGDKLSTLHYLFTLSMQHSMVWVGTGMMPSNAKSATRNDVNYVASFSGAMASTPSDASVDEMLPGDLETARLFGARVAEVAARYSVA